MNHSAQYAQQRSTHGAMPKPRAIVSGGRRAGRTIASNAIGDLLRLVARLGVDARASGNNSASTCAIHMHFISGYLAALEANRLVPADALVTLKHNCEVLLDGHLTLVDLRAMKKSGNDTDPVYLRAVSLVNRAGTADADKLAGQLDTTAVAARRLIERMHADGLLNEPDLFGIRTLVATPEVRHG
jgi:DNA segregation ATPase FtsK/SpoIIIE-like protein